jgi:hypothetical protein
MALNQWGIECGLSQSTLDLLSAQAARTALSNERLGYNHPLRRHLPEKVRRKMFLQRFRQSRRALMDYWMGAAQAFPSFGLDRANACISAGLSGRPFPHKHPERLSPVSVSGGALGVSLVANRFLDHIGVTRREVGFSGLGARRVDGFCIDSQTAFEFDGPLHFGVTWGKCDPKKTAASDRDKVAFFLSSQMRLVRIPHTAHPSTWCCARDLASMMDDGTAASLWHPGMKRPDGKTAHIKGWG